MLFLSGVSAAPSAESIVGAVVFDGVTVFNPEQLGPVYQPVIGQQFLPSTQSDLATRTRNLYVEHGFLEPAVRVNPHPSSPGIVRVLVTEPKISRIAVLNGTAVQRRAVQKTLAPLKQQRPVSQALINNTLRSLERSQKINLETDIRRMPGRGAAYRLELRVRPKIGGALTYTSEGDARLGRHLLLAELSVANPVRGVTRLGVSGLHTLESDAYRVAGGNFELGVSRRNSLALATKVGRAVLESDSGAADTVYRFRQTQAEWAYALMPEAKRDSELYTALVAREFTRTEQGVRELDERLRMADTGFRTLITGARRAHRLDLKGRVGFNDWGARRTGTQAGDTIDPRFQIARVQYTVWQALPAGFSLRADTGGQYSPDDLPSSQRFTIGGSRFARAYEPGELSGDNGIGGNLELRRGFSGGHWLPARLTPFIYYGVAVIHQNETSDRGSAAAAGLGLRVVAEGISGYLEFGKPLTANSRHREDQARLNGRVTVSF